MTQAVRARKGRENDTRREGHASERVGGLFEERHARYGDVAAALRGGGPLLGAGEGALVRPQI